jgi:hypothetical protein
MYLFAFVHLQEGIFFAFAHLQECTFLLLCIFKNIPVALSVGVASGFTEDLGLIGVHFNGQFYEFVSRTRGLGLEGVEGRSFGKSTALKVSHLRFYFSL